MQVKIRLKLESIKRSWVRLKSLFSSNLSKITIFIKHQARHSQQMKNEVPLLSS